MNISLTEFQEKKKKHQSIISPHNIHDIIRLKIPQKKKIINYLTYLLEDI